MKKIIAIVGPTASGKTALGVALAQKLGGEVVSADSMQVYRRMDIGTAKPTAEEMQGIAHHMIDVCDVEENYSVARYVREAEAAVEDILRRGRLPILVGGTGLYVDSLLSGRSFAAYSGAAREKLQKRCREEGIEKLLEQLREIDPEAAQKLHLSDEKRILRALEVWYETGKTITQHNAETKRLPPRYDALTIGLNFTDRRDMWQRIDTRVDTMVERGLLEEIQGLLDQGVPMTCTAMQAIGYKEFVSALTQGGDVEAAKEKVKLRSRQYAKRQLTWFRRGERTQWYLWDREPDFASALQFATEKAACVGIH